MKKILFATTALVASAGVAAADVSFSGYARMGAADNGTVNGLYTRIRLQIDMSTEADNGLTFGARLRHQVTSFNGSVPTLTDSAGDTVTYNPGFNAVRLYAKAGGFELAVGNIQGAWEWMPGVYGNTQSASIGLSGLGFLDTLAGPTTGFGWDAYSSGGRGAEGNQGVEVKYSAGNFGAHISYSDSQAPGGESTAAHASYSFNDWTVAVGMVDNGTARNGGQDFWGLTVGGKLGPANLTLGYADNTTTNNSHIVLRGVVDVGAATKVSAYVSSVERMIAGTTRKEAYGIGVSHSLGGGASVEGGLVSDYNENTRWDLGVRFNF